MFSAAFFFGDFEYFATDFFVKNNQTGIRFFVTNVY